MCVCNKPQVLTRDLTRHLGRRALPAARSCLVYLRNKKTQEKTGGGGRGNSRKADNFFFRKRTLRGPPEGQYMAPEGHIGCRIFMLTLDLRF